MIRNPHPYPSREYIRMASWPSDIIKEELRVGGKDAELRKNTVKGLGAIYGGSPLFQSLREYAFIYARAHALVASVQGESETKEIQFLRGQAFGIGALLSLRSQSSLMSTTARRVVTDKEVSDVLPWDKDPAVREQLVIDNALEIADYHQDNFAELSDGTQYAVTAFAESLFGDYPQQQQAQSEVDFLIGFMFTGQVLEALHDMSYGETWEPKKGARTKFTTS